MAVWECYSLASVRNTFFVVVLSCLVCLVLPLGRDMIYTENSMLVLSLYETLASETKKQAPIITAPRMLYFYI